MTTIDFGTPIEKKDFNKSTIKRTQFVDFKGTSIIRILSNSYVTENTHYMNKATVKCLEDECPICATNKVIIMQNPETFRDDPRYNPKRTVYMVNVLDKSPVRVCPNCGTENKASGNQTPACSKCNNILTGQPQPSSTVKVLSRGVTLFEHLGSINNAVLDAQGERVGLTGFDITLLVNGSGKDKTITPIPGQVSEPAVVDESELYDLSKVVIKLSPSELLDLQNGVSLRDIFSARKAGETVVNGSAEFITEDTLNKAQSEVDKLFGS